MALPTAPRARSRGLAVGLPVFRECLIMYVIEFIGGQHGWHARSRFDHGLHLRRGAALPAFMPRHGVVACRTRRNR